MHLVGERAFKRLHAVIGTGLDLGVDLGRFALPDQVADGGRIDQDLLGHHPAEGTCDRVGALAEGLGEDRLQAGA